MNKKITIQQQLDSFLSSITNKQPKPKLLLHACCAPCSSYFDITIYYYNPNIHPEQEYNRRLAELQNFIPRFPPSVKNNVKLVTAPYNPQDFFIATDTINNPSLQIEPERGERCRRCYQLRMSKAYEFAKANYFDYFTTTLSISSFKDATMINVIGVALEQTNSPSTLHYLPADFKKKNGF